MCIFFAQFNAAAQGSVRTELFEATVYFGFDRSTLDMNYRGNKESLESLSNTIAKIGAENIDAIEVTSFTSPQGVYEHNMLLARKRLADTKRYFLSTYADIAEKISFYAGGESWDKLREMIEADSKLSAEQKAAACKIIDADVNQGTKKWRMEQLPFYNYLAQTHYTRLRSACAVLVKYHTPEVDEPEPEPTAVEPEPEPVVAEPEPVKIAEPEPVEAPAPVVKASVEPEYGIFAFKTNLLYDLAIVPSVGVELELIPHLSAAANWQGAWWKLKKKDIFWQTYGGDVALRYWFGRKPLTGHHLGVYGQLLTYDFELGDRGYMVSKPALGGGIEYGYSKRITKSLSLDLEIGLGYISAEQKEYLPQDTHYVWQQTTHQQWFGPTKGGISLVWKPAMRKKGGSR